MKVASFEKAIEAAALSGKPSSTPRQSPMAGSPAEIANLADIVANRVGHVAGMGGDISEWVALLSDISNGGNLKELSRRYIVLNEMLERPDVSEEKEDPEYDIDAGVEEVKEDPEYDIDAGVEEVQQLPVLQELDLPATIDNDGSSDEVVLNEKMQNIISCLERM